MQSIKPMASSAPLRVTLRPLKPGHRGQPYSVAFRGRTIIASSRVPSHDACRHLVSLGLSGSLEVWIEGQPFPLLVVADIKRAAQWSLREDLTDDRKYSRYARFDRQGFMERLETADMDAA